MSATAPSRSNPPSPESLLAQAEAEMLAQENRLAEALYRARAEQAQLGQRLQTTREALAQPEGVSEQALGPARDALETVREPTLGIDAPQERARLAREAALEARRLALKEVQEALRHFQEESRALQQALTHAEGALEEAAAAAQRQKAEQARAEKARAEKARAEKSKAEKARATPPAFELPKPRQTRVAMQAAVDLHSDTNFFTGFSTNISEGGLFVATVQMVPVGTPVELTFSLPGGQPFTVQGKVAWVREVNDRQPELMPGLGVQFLELPEAAASAITTFVDTREPLFFPD